MKNILYYILVLSLCFTACEDEIDTYTGQDSVYFTWPVIGAYFGNTFLRPDSVGTSFAFENAEVTERVYKIPVSVQGSVSTLDRKINLTIDQASTAIQGVHYDLPDQLIFHANLAVDSIAVTVYRTAEMKDQNFTLILNLEPNEDFNTEMTSQANGDLEETSTSFIRLKVTFNDILTQPGAWFAYYMGDFTAKKLFLMSDLLAIDPAIFNDTALAGIGDQLFYATFMQRYLNEKKNEGETVYEEDGTEMIMGAGVQ